MTPPHENSQISDEGSLNLDSLNFEELGHTPECGGEAQNEPIDAPPEVVVPLARPPREPVRRELLENEFPPEKG